mgnify:CR=1 FL=1
MLNNKEIRNLIEEKDLISNYIDLDTQLQPNGFDLTIADVYELLSAGQIDFDNSQRRFPLIKSLFPDNKYGVQLVQGCYQILFNEVIKIPLNLIGISINRSSLMRCGCSTAVGIWDAGYEGKGKTSLLVSNLQGLSLYKNARIVQILFLELNDVENGYAGVFQGEGIR